MKLRTICLICKKGFFYYNDPRGPRKYCSMSCRNIGLRGRHPVMEFRPGPEQKHPRWKGDAVGYHGLHKWVQKHRGKAKQCESCCSTKSVVWANKSHEYKRDLNDWMELCSKCHQSYDRTKGWGVATAMFSL